MSLANSWNVVEVVRPQPGHAATRGAKGLRRPIVCNNSCATCTSSMRSPFGSGVSDTRTVSPMPLLQQHTHRGHWRRRCPWSPYRLRSVQDATSIIGTARQFGINRDQILHRRNLRRQNDAVLRKADLLGALRRTTAPTAPWLHASPRARRSAPRGPAKFSSINLSERAPGRANPS